MRIAVAVVLGTLVGLLGGEVVAGALLPLVNSGSQVLSWELASFARAVPFVDTQAATVVWALACALALPALCLCIAEVPAQGGGRGHEPAVFVLCASALGGLAAPPNVNPGPFLVVALVVATLLCLAPGDWAAVPVAFAMCALAVCAARVTLSGTGWVREAAATLDGVTHLPAGLWTVALAVPAVAMLAAAGALPLRARRGERA